MFGWPLDVLWGNALSVCNRTRVGLSLERKKSSVSAKKRKRKRKQHSHEKCDCQIPKSGTKSQSTERAKGAKSTVMASSVP